ncbi:uncharacterized protein HKW66_Vig0159400 [Vigna angularis]|uniref:Uncharacterized protein n=1 Tax=Phaseolus angularis TaxID=3914 RepID=A0A8T0JKH6_PHAAN|nr:uncharacterized protein HKW66_Vig0159400 [Vigna angularis]
MIPIVRASKADDIICGDFNHGCCIDNDLDLERTNDDNRHGCFAWMTRAWGSEVQCQILVSRANSKERSPWIRIRLRLVAMWVGFGHFPYTEVSMRIASSFVMATSQKTLKRTEKLKESVVGIGEDALGTLGRVIRTTNQMQLLLLPYNPQMCESLNSTTQDLRTNSRVIRRFIDRSEQSFDRATHTSYVAHFVVLTVNLVTLVAAIVLMLLYWRPGFIIFAEDACTAFEDFEKDPQNSSLGSMLPCMNESFSGKLIVQIGYTIHRFVVELNSNMSVIYRVLGVSAENEELLGVIKICDPFPGPSNLNYIPQSCPNNVIRIGDLSKILAKFTCHEEGTGEECKKEGRFLPEASYNMAHAYSRSIQDLLDIYPELQRLSKCTVVKNKVAEIVSNQCKPMRVSTKLLWSSMLSLSIIMVVLVFTWVAKALQWERPLSIYSRTPESI